MKFSRTVAYAVQATLNLAETGGEDPVPCSRLASTGKMPERFLLQILRTLVTHGILVSTRGVEGGYRLSRPAGDISLLEVVEAIDGPITASMEINKAAAARYHGRLMAGLNAVAATVRGELGAMTLADLLGRERDASA